MIINPNNIARVFSITLMRAGVLSFIVGNTSKFIETPETSHQYDIKRAKQEGQTLPNIKLHDSELFTISKQTAEAFIKEYEWLGYLGAFRYLYGLYWGKHLGAVVCFANPPSLQAAKSICGSEYADKVLLLSRGACAWWTPKNTASYAISKALENIVKVTDFRIIYAYADPRAGEIGQIYQALNWHYIGLSEKRTFHVPKGMYDTSKISFSTRHLPKEHKSKPRIESAGYEVEEFEYPRKMRYVTFLGDKRERKKYKDNLQWDILPYPKRMT